ncbi:hypothetical protein CBS101457_002682 [Exobasidium rhododendri]|nr:hypothetical protein CBS101457_002682 [Exobasidium rhododendri]
MASENFFEACQKGDVESLTKQLESTDGVDIDAKDGYGMTALAYAARNGHVEVVRQLLQKGADRREVLEQGYGRSIPEIAQLLEEGGEMRAGNVGAQVDEAGHFQGMQPHQMQDGNVYMNGGAYGQHVYPMMPGYGTPPPPGQQYFYDGVHAPNGSGRMSSQHQSHLRKDSTFNLPPPDVARTIPCRFFPNCRYGDKCLFAHPIMDPSVDASHISSPISPSMPQQSMQPMFYQQFPSGHPHHNPYGAGPQPFYPPMGPPNHVQQQFGHSMQFSPSIIQSHPQQQMQAVLSQGYPTEGERASVNDKELLGNNMPAEASGQATQETKDVAQDGDIIASSSTEHDKDEAAAQVTENVRQSTATPPQQDVAAPSAALEQGSDNKEGELKVEGDEQITFDAQGKPVHRRQSFNSFLHHHAIPFQPSAQPGPEAASNGTMQAPYPPRMGPKNRNRMAGMGPNGFVGNGKRMFGDRPACSFFANGKCRYGDECRFPHVLADGTDARPMQAQQRQMYAAQFGVGNGIILRNGEVSELGANTNDSNGSSATAPKGPQAEKVTGEKPLPQAEQHESLPKGQPQSQQQNERPAASASSESAANGGASNATRSAAIIRSNPSKTSTGNTVTNPSSRGGQSNKKHVASSTQRVPTVNDFPALAVPSPNLTSQTTSTPISPSLPIQHSLAAASTAATDAAADSSSTSTNKAVGPSPSSNGPSTLAAKANFSAILSAPAPIKARLSTETSKSNGATAEEVETMDSEAVEIGKVNGEEKAKTNGKPSGSKEGKGRAKTAKAESHKSTAAATATTTTAKSAPSNGAEPSDADDFQLVNRSRTSNKRVASNPSSNQSDGFLTQSKAVAA